MQRSMKARAKDQSAVNARVDEKALIARMRESARRRRAQLTDRPAEIIADGRHVPVKSTAEAQADFNRSVVSSLRLVAQHLQYVQKNFAAIERSQQQEADRNERASREVGERVAQLSATLEEIGKNFETIVARLSDMEQRTERELNQIRQSIGEWHLSTGANGEEGQG